MVNAPEGQDAGNVVSPILLSLFQNRFMSVAEAMGRSLKQTSISVNIKERLDYSCALFSPEGDLVANAPFIPVHLGSMSFAVKYQLRLHKDTLAPGDVLLSNSPVAGGSHLPDLTVITPCFSEAGDIIFFTASRAHHSDIGGILPGSMPPTSTCLLDEGAEIISFKIVSKGRFDRAGLVEHLVTKPARVPGGSACRNLQDVESDLKAQVAANHKGTQLLHSLIKDYGLAKVQAYMGHIRDNADQAVRGMLRAAVQRLDKRVFSATDHLDDGSPIRLCIDVDVEAGSAVFDFEGTGPQLLGNLNAPRSVVHAAIIYCMRAMIDRDIPLNAGCLVPLDIRIPTECFLSPSPTAAVCGGNVLTSQRITDVVLRAFEACAASQGCTNNLTFGVDSENGIPGWGCYETMGGGSGAGPSWAGTSCQVHMTNTRATDPEIVERRYPVILREFSIRPDSGGKGAYAGGNGLIRDLEWTCPLQVSIMSERRTYRPYGLHGGESGQCGQNLWLRRDTEMANDFRTISLGGKATVKMQKGDRLRVLTPGGGGYGDPNSTTANGHASDVEPVAWQARGSLVAASQPDF